MSDQCRVPELFSDRLILRAHGEADLDAAGAMWSHEDVVRHIGGRSFTREEVWHRILRYRGHWVLKDYGYWAIEERAGGGFIGEIGLADWKRPALAEYGGVPEAGWVLCPSAHGRGYAGEALGMVLAWADEHRLGRTICLITDANAASIRLARRYGYEAVGCAHAATVYARGAVADGGLRRPAAKRNEVAIGRPDI